MFDLSGKTALVTGAGQGIGRGIAEALATQGARVVVNDIHLERAESTVKGIAAQGGAALAVAFDVTDGSDVQSGIERATSETGPIDILVNNAGNAGDSEMVMAPFREIPPSEWQKFVDVNFFGVLRCTRAVLDPMCERGWGRIITTSSEAARSGQPIGISIYGAAKGAAVSFTRHLATEVGKFGVTVNCVSVGLMDNVPEEFSAPYVRRHPMRRLGSPADIGAAVVYLASTEAGWVTGQALPVNGGSLT